MVIYGFVFKLVCKSKIIVFFFNKGGKNFVNKLFCVVFNFMRIILYFGIWLVFL